VPIKESRKDSRESLPPDFAARKGFTSKVRYLAKYHLHVLLYGYFWFGLFVCGLVAPPERIALLESDLVTRGWHLSLLSTILLVPVLVLYVLRHRRQT